MLGQGIRVPFRAQLVEELGRTFDIGEQEGDGAGGEVSARHSACLDEREELPYEVVERGFSPLLLGLLRGSRRE